MTPSDLDTLLNFWPPDFQIEGADVAEMIREMPDRPIMLPRERSMKVEVHDRVSRPPRAVPAFNEHMIRVLFHAVNRLRETFQSFGRDWPIENYTVLMTWHAEHGVADIAFCPKVESSVHGVSFEVPDGGMYANGPAVRFFISLADLSVVKKLYMR